MAKMKLKEALELIEKLKQEIKTLKELTNGSNLIVADTAGKILVVREATVRAEIGKLRWLLPGGGIERGESPRHAAQSETEEETGIVTDEADYSFLGYFNQRPKGVVFLFATSQWSGEIVIDPKEVSEARFMSFEEIMELKDDFATGYLRMILRYKRSLLGIDKMPYEGRLSDRVEFPRNLDREYKDIVLTI